MPATSTQPARETQLPLAADMEPIRVDDSPTIERIRRKISIAMLPLAGVGATIGFTAIIRPGFLVGAALLTLEAALGTFAIYLLWPKQKNSR